MNNRDENFKSELKALLDECVNAGFTVYVHKELTKDEKKHTINTIFHRMWFFVTDGTTILYIGKNAYYNFVCTFEYIPTVHNGTGCSLNDDCEPINIDKIKRYLSIKTPQQLLQFNKNIDTKTLRLYKNAGVWFNCLWNKEKYEIIKK